MLLLKSYTMTVPLKKTSMSVATASLFHFLFAGIAPFCRSFNYVDGMCELIGDEETDNSDGVVEKTDAFYCKY